MGRVLSVKLVHYNRRDTDDKVEKEYLIPSREKPNHVDRGWAWLIVLGCSVSHMLAIMMMSSFGLLFVPIIEELDTTLEEITIIGNIMYGATYFTVTLASPICGIVSCRIMMCVGAFLLTGSFLSGYFLLNFYSFSTIGAIAGVGGGLLIASSLMAIRGYFDKKRHIALALILAANGTGSIIGPPIVTFLLSEFGLRSSLMMLSGIYLHGVVGGALLRPISSDLPQKTSHQTERPERLLCAVAQAYRIYVDKALFGSVIFYLCLLSSFFYLIGFMVTYSRLPDHMTNLTFTLEEASTTLLLAGAANTLGKLLGMILVDKTPRRSRFLYMCACVLSGGSLMAIPLCVDIVHFYAAAVGFGFFFGNIHYLGSMLFIEFFGPDRLSGCFGMVYLSYTIASFTGNPVAGMVAEMTSFRGAEFFFIGSSIVFAGFVMIPSVFVSKGRLTLQNKMERKDLESSILPPEISNINHTGTVASLEITDRISEKDSVYGAVLLTA